MMTTLTIVGLFSALYLILVLWDWISSRNGKEFLMALAIWMVVVLLAITLATRSSGYLTFGESASSIQIVVVLCLASLCGTAARYFFYLEGGFNLKDFLKPFCIAPLLFAPLIGSIFAMKRLEPMQEFYFALLAFENGFICDTILERLAKKRSQKSSSDSARRPRANAKATDQL